MTHPWQLRVYEKQQLVYSEDGSGTLELGRQSEGEAGPFHSRNLPSGVRRVVIARLDEDTVSRQHAQVRPTGDGKVLLINISKKLPIRIQGGTELPPGHCHEVPLPVVLTLGKKVLRVQAPLSPNPGPLRALAEATLPPGVFSPPSRFPTLTVQPGAVPDLESLIRWLQTTLNVLQAAAISSDFFSKAARAVVELVGLDAGRVLLLRNGTWEVEAIYTSADRGARSTPSASPPTSQFRAPAFDDWRPSQQVLASVEQEKRTFWEEPEQTTGSLLGIQVVVAAPILDRDGSVIGVLYGERRHGVTATPATPVTRIEAMLVELLASGVAAGLARMEQERAAVAASVRLEQFVTPRVARHLADDKDALRGRDAEVTVLFCDIRGFSIVTERLGPKQTFEWLNQVLDALSECVLRDDREGTLVDYTGDELLAMWGAPLPQPDHARRACDAALEMLGRLPELEARWARVVQEPLRLAIGVNTGMAWVGNVGSSRKLKYGPLGNTVNLGSRVQGAGRFLRTSLVVTASTHARVAGAYPSRRLCQVKAVNITEPVSLFELVAPGQEEWEALKAGYEQALTAFEGRQFRQAAETLAELLQRFPEDGPTQILLDRVKPYLREPPPDDFDPVWELPGK